jgi:hypothetical protein
MYSCNTHGHKNPFSIYGYFNNNNVGILIDTGADVSLIDASLLKVTDKITSYSGVVRSACGNQMKIIGKVTDLKINVGGQSITFSPLVVSQSLDYIILGIDTIVKYKFLILDALKTSNVKTLSEYKSYSIHSYKKCS